MHQGYKQHIERLEAVETECYYIIGDLYNRRYINLDDMRRLIDEIEYYRQMFWLDTLITRCQELKLMQACRPEVFIEFVKDRGL